MVAGGIVAGVAAPFVVPVAIGALGFGAGGVLAGSVAATFQAGIGNVVAGSVFSVLQSVGAAGVGSLTSLVVGGTAAGTAGGAAVAATGISYASAASGGMVYVDMMVPYLCAVAGNWIYQKFFY